MESHVSISLLRDARNCESACYHVFSVIIIIVVVPFVVVVEPMAVMPEYYFCILFYSTL